MAHLNPPYSKMHVVVRRRCYVTFFFNIRGIINYCLTTLSTSPANITLLVLFYWFLGVWLISIDARGVSSADADPMVGNYSRIVAVVQSRTGVQRSSWYQHGKHLFTSFRSIQIGWLGFTQLLFPLDHFHSALLTPWKEHVRSDSLSMYAL